MFLLDWLLLAASPIASIRPYFALHNLVLVLEQGGKFFGRRLYTLLSRWGVFLEVIGDWLSLMRQNLLDLIVDRVQLLQSFFDVLLIRTLLL